VTARAAAVSAARILKKPHVASALQRQVHENSVASLDYLIHEADEICRAAKQDKHYTAAIKAVETKTKLNKLFDNNEPELEGHINFVKSIFFTVNVSHNEAEAITVPLQAEDEKE